MFILSGLRKLVADPDIAVDLGTANTRLYAEGYGIIANEPSLIGLDAKGKVAAVGRSVDARSRRISPLRAGVVVDAVAASQLLKPLLRRGRRFGIIKPRVMAFVPTDACDAERQRLCESLLQAGAATVLILPEPLAAAIGAGLDITSPYSQMIVDIGDGVTDMAVIRSSELIATFAVRAACSDMHFAVSSSIEHSRGVVIYPQEAERITCSVGALRNKHQTYSVRGCDGRSGNDCTISVATEEIYTALDPVLDLIVNSIRSFLRSLSPQVACEVIESGICLTGGGAKLPGLPELIASVVQLDTRVAHDPLLAVINGAKRMLSASAGFVAV